MELHPDMKKQLMAMAGIKDASEFDQLVRIFYGALLWKNILYDLAKQATVTMKREQLKD